MTPTWQWVGVHNSRDRRGPHPIVERQNHQPATSLARTRVEEESRISNWKEATILQMGPHIQICI